MEDIRQSLKVRKERAVLVGVVSRQRRDTFNDNLVELTALAQSAGAVIVDRFQQNLYRPNTTTYIGKGKAQMLAERVERFEADVVIFDNDLSPGQIRELEKIVNVKIIDRSELILDIFATRAQTKQAKLQVELAQLQYTYPRLTRMWTHLDTVAGAAGGAGGVGAVGGIGTRGTGEKQLEIDRRLVGKRITALKRELVGIDKRKLREISGRGSLYKICLVGYTNAGKSTLMNALTDAGVFVEDRLFATLDTKTKKWAVEKGTDVLLSDTVGFVRKLPHHLVASFKATLEEAVNADLLMHVVDVSNSEVFGQIESVEKTLSEIGCGKNDCLVVLNKADAINSKGLLESVQTVYPQAVCISAKTGMNLGAAARAVLGRLNAGDVRVDITCDAGNGKIPSFIQANGKVISLEYCDSSILITAQLSRSQMGALKKLAPQKLEIAEP